MKIKKLIRQNSRMRSIIVVPVVVGCEILECLNGLGENYYIFV